MNSLVIVCIHHVTSLFNQLLQASILTVKNKLLNSQVILFVSAHDENTCDTI